VNNGVTNNTFTKLALDQTDMASESYMAPYKGQSLLKL
jgi:hypothetical protein